MEIWKDIDGFDNYEVSTFGNVRNKNTGRVLKYQIDRGGYYWFGLTYDKKRYCKLIHRLVAQAFISNPDNKPEVDHKDGNKSNNNVDNLRFATRQENIYNTTIINNANYISKHGKSIGYNIDIRINGKRIKKYARTIEDAIKIRDELLEQRNKEMSHLAEFIYPTSL